MNHRNTINHFIKNFLFDLPTKLRKKISEVVLAITLSRSLRISRISENSRKRDKMSQWGRSEFVRGLLEELDVEVVERLMVRVFDEDAEYVIGDIT
ncbi:MAG: hypothetical protein ABDH28_05895 [Brevinematia bacterium]